MNAEIIKKIIAEWLGDKVFPPLIIRDAPDLALERASEIIAVAGPRRAGKTCYMYQLIQDLLIPVSSPRRKPGSRNPCRIWIPAFAGMTAGAYWCGHSL